MEEEDVVSFEEDGGEVLLGMSFGSSGIPSCPREKRRSRIASTSFSFAFLPWSLQRLEEFSHFVSDRRSCAEEAGDNREAMKLCKVPCQLPVFLWMKKRHSSAASNISSEQICFSVLPKIRWASSEIQFRFILFWTSTRIPAQLYGQQRRPGRVAFLEFGRG